MKMMEVFKNSPYELEQHQKEVTFSVCGNHAWAGETPSFFIPAAKLRIGRSFSVAGCMARRVLSLFRQVCRCQERRERGVLLPVAAGAGRPVFRRL